MRAPSVEGGHFVGEHHSHDQVESARTPGGLGATVNLLMLLRMRVEGDTREARRKRQRKRVAERAEQAGVEAGRRRQKDSVWKDDSTSPPALPSLDGT